MADQPYLTADTITRLLAMLNDELSTVEVQGELFLVGGAVMCLVFNARHATRDVDGLFEPSRAVREAAQRVADKAKVSNDWLNDAAKGLIGPRGEFDGFLELSNLKVFVPVPEYLFAMKCLAMRLGPEYSDLDDVRYLLRYLNITKVETAMQVVTQYFDESQIPLKTQLALEELLGNGEQ